MKKMFGYLRLFLLLISILLLTTLSSNATTLPTYVLETLKTDLPKSQVRFDGLISTQNGTIYLPVLPSNPKKNASGNIVATVPAEKSLSQLPDVVLFDTNFALLKVIKTKDGKLTVAQPKDIPFVVKTGLFPQDMLVPPGLVIPDELEIMMGDLKIATTKSNINDIFKNSAIIKKSLPNKKIVPIPFMTGKTLLYTAIDSKILSFVPSDSTTPKFTLTMDNLPKFIQPVCDDRYILVSVAGKTYIDVADVGQEVIAKKIDLSYQPSEIVLNSEKTKAYVAVADDQAIFVIDLKSMQLQEKIKIKGYPKNISISADDSAIVYQDKNTGDIYTLALDETYLNKYIYNASNVSKLILEGNNIYILSRTLNELHVVDTNIKALIYKQSVAYKPIDMMLLDKKLYILSATAQMDIFNLEDFTYNQAIKFADKGFTKKMIKVPNTNILLITNVTEKKYFVYDYTRNALLQTVDTPVFVNDLQLMNRDLD